MGIVWYLGFWVCVLGKFWVGGVLGVVGTICFYGVYFLRVSSIVEKRWVFFVVFGFEVWVVFLYFRGFFYSRF